MRHTSNLNLLQQWLTRPVVLGDYSKAIPRWVWLTMMFWRFTIVLSALPMVTDSAGFRLQAAITGNEVCQGCDEMASRSNPTSR